MMDIKISSSAGPQKTNNDENDSTDVRPSIPPAGKMRAARNNEQHAPSDALRKDAIKGK